MISHTLRPLFLFLSFFLITSCSTSEQITAPAEQAADSPDVQERQALDLDRPVPYPIDIPDSFLSAIEAGTRTPNGLPGDDYWQNESSYELTAELLPEENRLNGTAVIRYTNNSPYIQEQLILELAQNMHADGAMRKEAAEVTGGMELLSVVVSGEELGVIDPNAPVTPGQTGYLVDATRMLVLPGEALSTGDTIELEIEWTFIIPQEGASGRMGHSQDNLYFISYWYPQMMVFDDVYGWFTDPFLGNAEFYHGFADYDIEITAPAEWLIMSSGDFLNPEEVLSGPVLQRYREAGTSDEIVTIVGEADMSDATLRSETDKLVWRFSADQVSDVAFSATRESIWEGARATVGDRDGDGVEDYTRINSFYRTNAPLWMEQAEYSQHSISFLSEFLDYSYPWPHMTSVEGAGIIGGGMEYPMITVMGSYNSAGAQQLHSVTAHEFAHMWIPMILSTNERRYSWMDEGFTTFNTHYAMADAYPEDFDNESVFASYLGFARNPAEGPLMRWSDFHYSTQAFGVASYPKPASILTALKGVIGEDLFDEAYHEFIDRWTYKHPYPWDFFNTFDDVTGRDLNWFWRSWYYETWVLDQAVGEVSRNGDTTRIGILDLGNVPMPVELLIRFEDGSERTETLPVDHWLNGNNEAEIAVESPSPAVEVIIDPEVWYPDVNRENNTWISP